jgi:hypothetical protein
MSQFQEEITSYLNLVLVLSLAYVASSFFFFLFFFFFGNNNCIANITNYSSRNTWKMKDEVK